MQNNPPIAPLLLPWAKRHGRRGLPWQGRGDAYSVWVSEIMLQQTRVETAIPYYLRFVERFPDIQALAGAGIDDVLALWAGLGYYARARNLHKAAVEIVENHGGEFPLKFDQVLALPGIGRSTAGAILALADGQHWPILDGNVRRVLCRYYAVEGWPGKKEIESRLWQLAGKNTPHENIAEYTQAIMDLGATVCTRKSPDCEACPLSGSCMALATGSQKRLPAPGPKKALPIKATMMLLVTNNRSEILLQRRPPTGIWGGLWSLPECAPGTDPVLSCNAELGFECEPARELESFRHSFSHYHLDIKAYMIRANGTSVLKEDSLAWFNPGQASKLGLPKPVKSLLERLEQHHD